MTSFVLKIIALITMACDHIGDSIVHKFSFWNVIGRIAFPIFAFQISEGYRHTRDLKKYFIRLFAFALVSQVPFMLFLSTFSEDYGKLNIFFTLLLGLSAITLFDWCNRKADSSIRSYIGQAQDLPLHNDAMHSILYKALGVVCIIVMLAIAHFTKCDYGWYGVAIIFLFYLFRENKLWMNLSFIIVTAIKYIQYYLMAPSMVYAYMYMFLGVCSSLIFINLYNGKKGPGMKYFLYIFYPAHLLLLYLIHILAF